jgi:ribosomal protein L12E/L44/L45/RPP1/RPP2
VSSSSSSSSLSTNGVDPLPEAGSIAETANANAVRVAALALVMGSLPEEKAAEEEEEEEEDEEEEAERDAEETRVSSGRTLRNKGTRS